MQCWPGEVEMASCKTCVYSAVSLAPESKQAGQLICRATPPQSAAIPIQTPQGMSIQIMTLWPIVTSADICGGYESQDESKISKPS